MTPPASTGDRARLAFTYVGFRFFWLTTLSVSFAVQIMAVAIAWQIYDVTGNAFLLGLVGLCLFAPALLLILVTGLTADRYSRRGIMRICLFVELALAACSTGNPRNWPSARRAHCCLSPSSWCR